MIDTMKDMNILKQVNINDYRMLKCNHQKNKKSSDESPSVGKILPEYVQSSKTRRSH